MDLGRFKKEKTNKQTWLDWLSDAPPPASVQQEVRQKRVEQANTYTPRLVVQQAPPVAPVKQASQAPTAAPKPVTPAAGVSISINIPEWRKPQFRRTKAAWAAVRPHLTRSRLIKLAIVAVILGSLWGGLALLKHRSDQRLAQAAHAKQAGQNAVAAQDKPTFIPAVPSSKQELVTPDGKNSKFDPVKGSYSFVDDIGGKKFTVSEQQVPAGQKLTDVVSKAAKSLNAGTQLKTGWGTAYLLTNQKYNSQTLVLGVHDLLVFIASSFTFTQDQWTTYINTLQ